PCHPLLPCCECPSSYYFTLVLLFYCFGDHLYLHSFPTRRSSDLIRFFNSLFIRPLIFHSTTNLIFIQLIAFSYSINSFFLISYRSEEHTSELQSRENLVCRLLLEKINSRLRRRGPGRRDSGA